MQFLILAKKNLSILSIVLLTAFLTISAFSTLTLANELTPCEEEAAELLNKDRADQGLPPLKVDMRLTRLGRSHAEDMIARNYFDHINPDGQSPFDRMKKAGIRYRAAGENIAMHYSVAGAQESWMQSPGHRANILSKDFTHVGIGIAEKNDGALYLVQVFAAY